jgi:hypothetical protein
MYGWIFQTVDAGMTWKTKYRFSHRCIRNSSSSLFHFNFQHDPSHQHQTPLVVKSALSQAPEGQVAEAISISSKSSAVSSKTKAPLPKPPRAPLTLHDALNAKDRKNANKCMMEHYIIVPIGYHTDPKFLQAIN